MSTFIAAPDAPSARPPSEGVRPATGVVPPDTTVLTRPAGRTRHLTWANTRRLAPDVSSVVLIAAFVALLLRHTLLQGGAMVGFDLYNYFFPSKVFTFETLRQGQLPLWNPYIFAGVPFLANIQMAVLYPPNLLFGLLDFARAVAVSQWFHLTLAGAGMYFLGRLGWRLDATGSALGGLAFAGSGFFGAHMGHLNQVHAGAWLPWIALCQLQLARSLGRWWLAAAPGATPTDARRQQGGLSHLRSGSARGLAGRVVWWLFAGGVCVALQLLAGHTQEAYYSLFALGLFAAAFTLFPPWHTPLRWTHLLAYAATVANGVALAGAQLLPTLELSHFSYRQGGVPLSEAVAYAVDRTNILESILPTFWSLPSQEVTGYVGVITLLLAVVALAVSPSRRTVAELVGVGLLAFILALGSYTPLFGLFYKWLPLFDSFRAPGRWLLIWTFAVAGLAAHGLTGLRYRASSLAREATAQRLGASLALASGVLALAVWRTELVHAIQWLPQPRVLVLWALAGLTTLALGWLGLFSPSGWPRVVLLAALALELSGAAREMEYNHPGPPDLYQQRPAIATYLQQREGAGASGAAGAAGQQDRVVSLAAEERLNGDRLRQALPMEGEARHYGAMREVLRPNWSAVTHLPSLDGYDGGLLPLAAFVRFKSLLITREPAVPDYTLAPQAYDQVSAALLGALNVRYLLTDGRYGEPGAGWVRLPDAPGPTEVYQNVATQPRPFLVNDVAVEPNADAALNLLRGADLTRFAVVDRALPQLLAAASGASSSSDAPGPSGLPGASGAPGVSGATGASTVPGQAQVTKARFTSLEVHVEAAQPALLVLSDTNYPGWRVTVDGQAAPLVTADVLFRGVPVPAGSHTVRFSYRPRSLLLGVAVSVVALLTNLALLVWFWRGLPWWPWSSRFVSRSRD